MVLTTSRKTWTDSVSKQSKAPDLAVARLIIYTIKVTYGAGDNYATGGNAISLKDVGLKEYIAVLPFNPSNTGLVATYDTTNEKIILRAQEPTNATAGVIALSELASGSTLTNNMTIEFLVIGK